MARTTFHEHQELWEKWIEQRDMEACNQLMHEYQPLVHYHVQRIGAGLPKSVRRDDLWSHAMAGLYDAMKKFDFSRDLKFDTYASFRIKGSILDGLRQQDWMPRSLREKSKKLEETTEMLEQKHGRYVTEEEVAQQMNVTTAEVRKVSSESFFANVLSMDEESAEGDKSESFKVALRDEKTLSPEDIMMKEASIQELAEVIQSLNEKEKMVVSLFYTEEMTLTEIGEIMSLSTSRISQIHSKALFKLKQALEKRKLQNNG